jgi:tetratricopeptide (TPR) repeat protein
MEIIEKGPIPRVLLFLLTAAFLPGCNSSPSAKEARYLQKGQTLTEKKDFARALLEFRNAAQVMPKDAEPWYQTGLAALGARDVRTAVAALRNVTDLNPKYAGAQLKLAELLESTRKKDLAGQAATRLENVLATSPEDPEANDALAGAEWQLGKTSEAAERLEQTLKKLPGRLRSARELARLKISQKDPSGAIAVLEKAAANAPQSAPAALALGLLYRAINQREKAESEVRRSLALDPKNPFALLLLATIERAGNRMAEAEQTYKQLAALPDKAYRAVHALFLYQTGKRDPAVAEWKQIVASDPENRSARNQLVAAFKDMGELWDAQAVLSAALQHNPKDSDALLQRGILYERAGMWTDADAALEQVLHLNPDWAEAHYALAEVHRAQGSVEHQRQDLNEALRLKPALLNARIALAKSLNGGNQAKAALEVLKQAPEAQKKTLGWIVERNWLLLAVGDYQELRSSLDSALRLNRYPQFVVQDAVLRLTQGDFSGSRASAGEILARYPHAVRAARILVNSYTWQNDPAKTIAGLVRAEARFPQSAPLHDLIGQWYLRAGKLPEARKALDSAKVADSQFLDADLHLAQLDFREKRVDDARKRVAGLLAANPKDVEALLVLGQIEELAGNTSASMAAYRRALDRDGSNLIALNNLAYELARSNPDEALKFARQAAERAPEDPRVQDTLGWVYYRKGNYHSAVSYLRSAVAMRPTPIRRFHLAKSYLKSGNQTLGEEMLRKALADDPNLPKKEPGW